MSQGCSDLPHPVIPDGHCVQRCEGQCLLLLSPTTCLMRRLHLLLPASLLLCLVFLIMKSADITTGCDLNVIECLSVVERLILHSNALKYHSPVFRNPAYICRWEDRVTIVAADMRYWEAPQKADILVSELLGSFGDNELSPECLDGAQRFLREDGISIPSSYTSYLQPVTTCKLWNDVKAILSFVVVASLPESASDGLSLAI